MLANNSQNSQQWWSNFYPCITDQFALYDMRNYCGGVLQKTIPMNIELVNNSGQYGARNLYCRWIARVPISAQTVNFNFTRYMDTGDQYVLETFYTDGKSYFTPIEPKVISLEASQLMDITIHYLTSSSVQNLPFQIIITSSEQGYTNFIGLFISIGIIVLICIVCSIFFYRCSKVIMENNRRLQERRALELALANAVNNLPSNREEEIKHQNKDLLNALFQNDLKPCKYTSELNEYNLPKCTICLEPFSPNTEVIKLYCKHIFHFNCLTDWLDKILLEPKCPVCNDYILPKTVESEFSSPIIAHNVNPVDNSRRDLLVINRNNYLINDSSYGQESAGPTHLNADFQAGHRNSLTNSEAPLYRPTNAVTERHNPMTNLTGVDINSPDDGGHSVLFNMGNVDRNNYIQ
jgi:hypothetical protein